MNLPNKLTLLRIILIPIFIFLFIAGAAELNIINIGLYYIDLYRLFAATVFTIASITDFLDGKIARKYNLITNFGKLMDPLADKMLVVSSLLMLSMNGEVSHIMTLIVILREISVSSVRLVALESGRVVAASKWGKYKTATQMIAITLYLFNICSINFYLCVCIDIIFYISMVLVIVSFIDYIIKNKDVILQGGL